MKPSNLREKNPILKPMIIPFRSSPNKLLPPLSTPISCIQNKKKKDMRENPALSF